jgi:hypothetical protein
MGGRSRGPCPSRSSTDEAWPKKQCERTVKNHEELARWLTCVRKKEKLLIGEVKWEKENLRLAAGDAEAPDELRGLAKDLGETGRETRPKTPLLPCFAPRAFAGDFLAVVE